MAISSLDALLEYFISAGEKGVTINRYKGLGEMNPDQLWSTTMNPEVRTLLQVRAEDHTEADQMFTTLMGDQVEPRRKFIEDNALDVRTWIFEIPDLNARHMTPRNFPSISASLRLCVETTDTA